MLFRILNTLFLSVLPLTFSFTQERTAYQVDGYVFLEDGDNHRTYLLFLRVLITGSLQHKLSTLLKILKT